MQVLETANQQLGYGARSRDYLLLPHSPSHTPSIACHVGQSEARKLGRPSAATYTGVHKPAPHPATALCPAPAPPTKASARPACPGARRSAAFTAATRTDAAVAAAQPPNTFNMPDHWAESMKSASTGRRRVLQRYMTQVVQVNALEPVMKALSDAELQGKTGEFKQRLAAGQSLDSLLPEAFATVREAAQRVLGMRHYDCQLVGGMVLHEGQIAEMRTGEGKTLVATLPVYLNALTGEGVHVVTVNDYLAARDAEWMGKVYRYLGLTCSAVQSGQSHQQLRTAFASDITYITGQELGFSYLKDNTAMGVMDLTLRETPLHFAVVDEVDSILIDESRNPMIISSTTPCNKDLVKFVEQAVRVLLEFAGQGHTQKQFYVVDEKSRSVSLQSMGVDVLFQYMSHERPELFKTHPDHLQIFEGKTPLGQLSLIALQAHKLYLNGRDYIVQEGKVVLIDQNTGRVRHNTRWQNGLHQAVEAKEGVEVDAENQVTATVTFQLFFKMYQKLAGMTGTASAAAPEFHELYGLTVVPVPPNRSSRRHDHPPKLYLSPAPRYEYLSRTVQKAFYMGRPVLIGTTSVSESEDVMNYLLHSNPQLEDTLSLLNAKPDLVRSEAQIIAQAGLPGAVTIATNMAGRGTDIILGGNPEGLTKLAILRLIYRRLLPDLDQEYIPALPAQLGLQAYEVLSIPDAIYPSPDEQLPTHLHKVLVKTMCLSYPSELARKVVREAAARDQLNMQQVGHTAPAAPVTDEGWPAMPPRAAPPAAPAETTSLDGLITESGPTLSGLTLEELDARFVPRVPLKHMPVLQSDLTFAEIQKLASWVMERAEELRKDVYARIRSSFGDIRIDELEYTVGVCPKIHNVWLLAMEGPLKDEPQGQVATLESALYLWLWFDRVCAENAARVRAAGGLLVIGTSVNESKRIEQQLRGRAGRQGDPGETLMLYDARDPMLVCYGMGITFETLRSMHPQGWNSNVWLEGAPVSTIVDYVVNGAERQFSNFRLETKKYDQVMEEYRNNLYSLRRMLLAGSDSQLTQVIYIMMQRHVDGLVHQYLDASLGPSAWTQPSVPTSSLHGWLQTPQLALTTAAGAASGTQSGQSLQQAQEQLVSPWRALMHHLDCLVNPPDRASKVKWEFRNMEKKHPALMSWWGKRTGLTSIMQVGNGVRVDGLDDSTFKKVDRATPPLDLPNELEYVSIFTPEQKDNLTAFLSGTAPLHWPQPEATELQNNLELRLLLLAHRRLLGYGEGAKGGGSGGEVRYQGVTVTQRPQPKGKYADMVLALRHYLGEALIHSFEMRRLGAAQRIMAQGYATTDLDARVEVRRSERNIMLLWLDAYWSAFLQDTERIRKCVSLRSVSGSSPLAEFRMEANVTFLALLDNFRASVIEKVLQPDMRFTSAIDPAIAEAVKASAPMANMPTNAAGQATASATASQDGAAETPVTVQAPLQNGAVNMEGVLGVQVDGREEVVDVSRWFGGDEEAQAVDGASTSGSPALSHPHASSNDVSTSGHANAYSNGIGSADTNGRHAGSNGNGVAARNGNGSGFWEGASSHADGRGAGGAGQGQGLEGASLERDPPHVSGGNELTQAGTYRVG